MFTIAGSVVVGLLAAFVVTIPWALLSRANITYASGVPWAVPIAAAGLWAWWQYMNGKGAPASTIAWRRANVRALPVSDDVWSTALFAGMVGLGLSLIALNIANRLASAQYVPLPMPLQLPPIQTALALNVMGATIAGVVEEATFRGYMQRPIERRFGPVVAIAISATAFWLAHMTRTGTFAIAPFYLTYGVVFGALAYFSGSIYPGMVLHVGGDALAGLGALARSGTGASVVSTPASGFDATFAMIIAMFLLGAAATVVAFRALARVASQQQPSTR